MSTIELKSASRPGRPKGWKKGTVRYSKVYLQRVDDTRALRGSIAAFKPQVAEGFGDQLAPELAEGEALPDFGLSIELLGRSVTSALERLRVTEHQIFERERKVVAVRRRSEKLARSELYPRVVLVRRLIDTELGKKGGRRFHGMSGRTLRKARRLHYQLGHLMWSLETECESLPHLKDEGIDPKREAWLSKIQPGYRQLGELLEELADLEVLEQLARDDRNEALRKFDDAYAKARRFLEASFNLAGLNGKLSSKLRSYVHRRQLSKEARRKREARSESRVKQTLRSAAASVTGWFSSRTAA